MIAAHPARRPGRRNPIASGTIQDPPLRPGECGSISGQLTFPRYTLMRFVHALDAIFELTAVVRKLLSHLIDAARHVATERGPDGDNLADFELVEGHWFLDLGRRWCSTLDLHSTLGRSGEIRSQRSCSLSQLLLLSKGLGAALLVDAARRVRRNPDIPAWGYFGRRLPNSMSAVRLPATHAGAGGQVSTLHCLRFPPN